MQESLLNSFASIGITLTPDALLIVMMVIVALLVACVATLLSRWRVAKIQAAHTTEREALQQLNDDQIDHLSHTFSALSQRALQSNNDAFLNLAKQNFEQLRIAASGDLQARQQSFTNLIKPIEESIKATEQHLQAFDTNRRVSDAKLGEQITGLMQAQLHLQSEARQLSAALRRPEVRGQWGELTLRRLVELAGLSEYCDFNEQPSADTGEQRIRPDMVIHLPSERDLIVDAKTPLDAYISAAESTDHQTKKTHLQRHAKQVRERITELASKRYWAQFERAPDFVILFIPGDHFLSAALQEDPSMLEMALRKQVLLTTPTSLVGLLRAIAYGWSQTVLSKNTEQLKASGEQLAQRLVTLTEHLNKLGTHLDQALAQYNRLVGSFQQSTVPALKRLTEAGLNTNEASDTEPTLTRGDTARRVNQTTIDALKDA